MALIRVLVLCAVSSRTLRVSAFLFTAALLGLATAAIGSILAICAWGLIENLATTLTE
jgi:hypothetical protein